MSYASAVTDIVEIFENLKRPVKTRFRALVPATAGRGSKEFYGPSAKSVKQKAFRWLKQQENLRKGQKNGETLTAVLTYPGDSGVKK